MAHLSETRLIPNLDYPNNFGLVGVCFHKIHDAAIETFFVEQRRKATELGIDVNLITSGHFTLSKRVESDIKEAANKHNLAEEKLNASAIVINRLKNDKNAYDNNIYASRSRISYDTFLAEKQSEMDMSYSETVTTDSALPEGLREPHIKPPEAS